MLSEKELKDFLDEKADLYNRASFIQTDPIQIPHLFTEKEDIEIAAFFAATIAWGQRKTIIGNAKKLMLLFNNEPFHFIMHAKEPFTEGINVFKHRTFQPVDLKFFIESLQNIYLHHNGLEGVFSDAWESTKDMQKVLQCFREVFFSIPFPGRTTKHVSDVTKNASAKRLCMFLRWMVRNDNRGVDFGIWDSIPAASLHIPLDVHTGNISRKLNLLQRTQNDWKAVVELTQRLRAFDDTDPIKYDFALFGLGAFENF